eukprot:EG_transcript_4254
MSQPALPGHPRPPSVAQLRFGSAALMERSSPLLWLGTRTRSFFFRSPEAPDNPRWCHSLPEHPTLLDHCLSPFLSFLAWMRLLCDNFDSRFIVMVFCGLHLLKGMLSAGLSVVEGLIYMQLRVGASTKTVYTTVGNSAFGLKPLYALVSDMVSVGGYRRGPWVIATALLATLAYATVAFKSPLTGVLVCICFLCAKLQVAWTDIMIEATYTEKMEDVPQYSPDILSFSYSGIGLFGMVGILIAGPGVGLVGPTHLLAFAIPVAAIVIAPTALGYMTEKQLPPDERGFRLVHVRRQWNYFLCSFILVVGVMVTMVAGVLQLASLTRAAIAFTAFLLAGVAGVTLLPAVIWKPLMFMFVVGASSLDIRGFVDNFYLDPATEEESWQTGFPVCKDCPHFHPTFYYTVIGLVDSFFIMIGSYIFSRYLSKWTYRRTMCLTTILSAAATSLDIVIYQRWNVALGLPDWMFMMAKASAQNTVAMIAAMPGGILISKVCPHGLEATVFALFTGFANFGRLIAGYLGAYALTLVGMDHIGKGAEDDFSNAWKACVLSLMSAPIALLLLPLLIPDALITDELERVPSNLSETTQLPGDPDFRKPSSPFDFMEKGRSSAAGR